jgi:chromosome segregation ATPase
MDQYIYKFWEGQFMDLEKGWKQMEDITRWIMGGLSGFEELSESFGKFWDMDFWFRETQDYMKVWETTTNDFQKLFTHYMDTMGLASKVEHLELIKQYKALKERVADQAIEISSEFSRQKEIIADQKQMIMDQKNEIAKQNKLVLDQKELIKDLKKEISGHKNEVSKQKKIIANQKEKLAGQKKIVAELKKEIAVQIKSIKQLQKQTSG